MASSPTDHEPEPEVLEPEGEQESKRRKVAAFGKSAYKMAKMSLLFRAAEALVCVPAKLIGKTAAFVLRRIANIGAFGARAGVAMLMLGGLIVVQMAITKSSGPHHDLSLPDAVTQLVKLTKESKSLNDYSTFARIAGDLPGVKCYSSLGDYNLKDGMIVRILPSKHNEITNHTTAYVSQTFGEGNNPVLVQFRDEKTGKLETAFVPSLSLTAENKIVPPVNDSMAEARTFVDVQKARFYERDPHLNNPQDMFVDEIKAGTNVKINDFVWFNKQWCAVIESDGTSFGNVPKGWIHFMPVQNLTSSPSATFDPAMLGTATNTREPTPSPAPPPTPSSKDAPPPKNNGEPAPKLPKGAPSQVALGKLPANARIGLGIR